MKAPAIHRPDFWMYKINGFYLLIDAPHTRPTRMRRVIRLSSSGTTKEKMPEAFGR